MEIFYSVQLRQSVQIYPSNANQKTRNNLWKGNIIVKQLAIYAEIENHFKQLVFINIQQFKNIRPNNFYEKAFMKHLAKSRGVFRTQSSNIYDRAFFAKIAAFSHFAKTAPSQMFDWVQKTQENTCKKRLHLACFTVNLLELLFRRTPYKGCSFSPNFPYFIKI